MIDFLLYVLSLTVSLERWDFSLLGTLLALQVFWFLFALQVFFTSFWNLHLCRKRSANLVDVTLEQGTKVVDLNSET